MSTQLGVGRPRTEVSVVDASIVLTRTLNGFVCVQGATAKGEPYKATFIPNWETFVEVFGGLQSDNDFPLYCKRALEAGAKLYVSRVAHWDSTDWEGTKASATITEALNSITFTAKHVGAGYNGVVISIANARSGDTTKLDITETQGRYSKTLRDFPKATTANDLSTLNNFLRFAVVNSLPATMPIGTGLLAGGTQDLAQITDADYIGDNTTQTKGWFAFDNVQDALYVANIDRAVPSVDAALAGYCQNRNDVLFLIRPTVEDNQDWQTMVDYRMGTGSYTHTPLDTWQGQLIAGNILINDPLVSEQQKEISAIADVVGLMCTKDTQFGEWRTTAGAERGRLRNNNGVPYNLGSAANKDFFDQAYERQINPVIQDAQFGVVFWGNRSLLRDQGKLLKSFHIATLTMFIKRSILPIVRSAQFEPNSPSYWNLIYRRVKPFIEQLEANGAIRAGEGNFWFWQGDQNASDLNSLEFNTKADVDAGIYRARFLFVPTTVMEYIGIEAMLTDSTSITEIVEV